jgi:6-phosphogluconate dehydrogenase
MSKSNLGLIGLAVMGQNLVLNFERNGFQVSVYNRTTARTDEFMAGPAAGRKILPAHSVEALVQSLERPRMVMIMVKAGAPVDAVIEELRPYLEPGDLIIDGGNSYFRDTERRVKELAPARIGFLGVGISGGEEGALRGPSIMPGGDPGAYQRVAPLFAAIAAKANGEPCVTYLGPGGSGHYVKMVHNGIEYGVMQLIAEAYDLLGRGLGLPAEDLQAIFAAWNEAELSSFLIEITAEILKRVDPTSGQPLVDLILDVASQKGTGAWTSQEALELQVPIPTITAAVEARFLSGEKSLRVEAARLLPGPSGRDRGEGQALIETVRAALYASIICAYAQGLHLLRAASQAYAYNLDLAEIARIWRAGCIIRARLLEEVRAAYAADPDLPSLLLAPSFRQALADRQAGWRSLPGMAASLGSPLPAMGASLAAYDGLRSARLPANLIQAQRDFFGAHTYRRVDQEGDFHTEWIG